ncbi:MAG: adenylate/guanylate cyclase domain-containing protein [Dongiaceae bacterium]
MGRMQRRSFIWEFDQPPSAIWPILADTARFNEAAALPKHEIEEIPQADGAVLYLGRIKRGPVTIEWREKPVNWVTDQWFEHCREFRSGPLKSLCATLELEPDGGGCRGTYTIEAAPANLLGRLILAGGFFDNAGKKFGKLAAEANEYAAGTRPEPFNYAPPDLGSEARTRLAGMVASIEGTPNGHGLAGRLAEYVARSQEVDLWQVRPLKLAREWHIEARSAIELCLQAVKTGLLELRWDLLCPRCRVAKSSSSSLDRLPTGAHCGSCNIDYGRDFSRNVEASFRPSAAIRPIEGGQYCLFGPMSTPHIKVHLTLDPGQSRDIKATLDFGDYRLRTLEPGPEVTVDWHGGGFAEIIADDGAIVGGAPSPLGMIRMTNRAKRPLTLIVEERAWVRDALTADRITALQAFRDLFAREALRPGDDVAIGQVTLMFTDLKGSTAFYERVGDAKAYHLVRDHFAFLASQIREQSGAVVKTIGDAVMATFADPAGAVRAAVAIQRMAADFNSSHGDGSIVIKLGLHKGPCIAVTLNDRLDYFGSTVNLAARLQGQSNGGDIVLSDDLAADPTVQAILAGLATTQETTSIKGFERAISFRRIAPAALAIAD